MAEARSTRQFGELYDAFKAGQISRRSFISRGVALGVGMPVLGFLLRTVPAAGAQDAPAAGGRPSVGTEGKTRGQDGELKILQWQAPTLLSSHVATGTKDFLAASIVQEPLLNFLPDGSLIANLVTEVPSVENGLLSEDLTTVTFNILPGVVWSDGEPFTADDVVFTHEWITNPENNSVTLTTWEPISAIEAVDDATLRVTYETPNVTWYVPFAGDQFGLIYPRHYIEANGHDAFLTAPIGTGPYVVESFEPGDQVIYQANPNYREENKPFFQTVNLKGGGAADQAAQSVLQTGDWDYAWNMQVEPQVLAQYEEGGNGRLVVVQGTSNERININFSDPNTEGPDGQRSWYENPHPFLSDPAVRQAMNVSIDRDTISERFYFGEEEPATANILVGLDIFESPNTSYTFDIEQGNQILEDAGWTKDGDFRSKDGVQLKISYSTTINTVRQKTQAVAKQNLEDIGIEVTLQQTDSAVYFDGAPGNDQNINHMYVDVTMYTNGASSPTPIDYMIGWYAGPDNSNVAQAANGWNGQNYQRYINPEYDRLFDELRLATDIESASQVLIQLNDILINDVAIIPLVHRAADKYSIHNSLLHGEGDAAEDNVALSAFQLNYWNIQNWNRSTPVDR